MPTTNTPIRPGARVSARPAGYFDRNQPVALRSEEARAEFITKTYLHLSITWRRRSSCSPRWR